MQYLCDTNSKGLPPRQGSRAYLSAAPFARTPTASHEPHVRERGDQMPLNAPQTEAQRRRIARLREVRAQEKRIANETRASFR